MARTKGRRSLAIYRPRPVVIRTTKVVHSKKHHRRHGRGGLGEKHRVGAIVGAGILGYIDKANTTVPTIPLLGRAGTLGLAAWAASKYLHSAWAEDLATGFLAVAAYELTKTGTISGVEGMDGYVAGGL